MTTTADSPLTQSHLDADGAGTERTDSQRTAAGGIDADRIEAGRRAWRTRPGPCLPFLAGAGAVRPDDDRRRRRTLRLGR